MWVSEWPVQEELFPVDEYAVPVVPKVDVLEDGRWADVMPQNEVAALVRAALADKYHASKSALGWVTEVEGAWDWALELKVCGVSVVYEGEVI